MTLVVVGDIEVRTRFLDGGYYKHCTSCGHSMRFPTELRRCPSCCAPFSQFEECTLEEYRNSRRGKEVKE